MTEIFCDDVVFHFNKRHLEDSSVPMWTLKARGQSYYVTHVDCQCTWSTKETFENTHTKGSIKVKNAVLIINDFNEATLRPATLADKLRLKPKSSVRVVWGNINHKLMSEFLLTNEIPTTEWKNIVGGCGTNYWLTDVLDNGDVVQMELAMWGKFRRVQPNEPLYRSYDNPHEWDDDDDDQI